MSSERLVWAKTEDKIKHAGLVVEPDSPTNIGIVWIHGLYQNFTDNPGVLVGRTVAENGMVFITGNNRGHDFGALLKRESDSPLAGGGGWEQLGESDRDIQAWLDYAKSELGITDIILVGHSFGTRKILYYLLCRADPAVKGVVLISTRILNRQVSLEIKAIAEKMVEEGRGKDLIPWPAYGCSMSADTYLQHSDPEAIFQNLYLSENSPLKTLSLPLLTINGELEDDIDNMIQEIELARGLAQNTPSFTMKIAECADHYYTDREKELAISIIDWIANYLY